MPSPDYPPWLPLVLACLFWLPAVGAVVYFVSYLAT
jgi:hypothetical protein